MKKSCEKMHEYTIFQAEHMHFLTEIAIDTRMNIKK